MKNADFFKTLIPGHLHHAPKYDFGLRITRDQLFDRCVWRIVIYRKDMTEQLIPEFSIELSIALEKFRLVCLDPYISILDICVHAKEMVCRESQQF